MEKLIRIVVNGLKTVIGAIAYGVGFVMGATTCIIDKIGWEIRSRGH